MNRPHIPPLLYLSRSSRGPLELISSRMKSRHAAALASAKPMPARPKPGIRRASSRRFPASGNRLLQRPADHRAESGTGGLNPHIGESSPPTRRPTRRGGTGAEVSIPTSGNRLLRYSATYGIMTSSISLNPHIGESSPATSANAVLCCDGHTVSIPISGNRLLRSLYFGPQNRSFAPFSRQCFSQRLRFRENPGRFAKNHCV